MNQEELDEFVRLIFKEAYLLYIGNKNVNSEEGWIVLVRQVKDLCKKYNECPLVMDLCMNLICIIEKRNMLF